MVKFVSLRQRPAIASLMLSLGFAAFPGIARADLLVNDFSDTVTVNSATQHQASRLAPVVAFAPRGPAAEEPPADFASGGLLALLAVFVHPPIDPTPATSKSGGGTVISGSSGGGGTHTGGGSGGDTGSIASTSPEPASLVTALVGVALAGAARLRRRRRAA
jgi:hypothetical protein